MYGMSDREATGSAPGYSAVMSGVEMGLDVFLTDDLLVGVMGGYGATTIKFDGLVFAENDKETQEMLTLGGYLGYRNGPWRLTDTLSLSRIAHETRRNAGLGQTATADYSSWLANNRVMGEYVWVPAEQWELAPQLGMNASALHRGGYAEQDAANALRYDDLDKLFMESIIGLRATRHIDFRDYTLSPFAGVSWNHDILGNDVTIRQQLSTTAAEVTSTNDDDHVGLNLGLALVKGAGRITLEYAGEFSENAESHGVNLNFRLSF